MQIFISRKSTSSNYLYRYSVYQYRTVTDSIPSFRNRFAKRATYNIHEQYFVRIPNHCEFTYYFNQNFIVMTDKGKTNGLFSAEQIMKMRPENIHMGSKSSSDSCDISDMIDKSGCSLQYYKLEECLGENDRKWSLCQKEVKELQNCNKMTTKKS